MPEDAKSDSKRVSELKSLLDSSRNRRQAAVFLVEIARHHCEEQATTYAEGKKKIEESKKLRQRAQGLRKARKAG
jgi:hypothetical protein